MQDKKSGFLNELKKSVKDFDKYEDFAISPTNKSMKYFLLIILFFSIVIYGIFIYKFSISDDEGIKFFKENIVNINYEQEDISINGINDIIIQNKNNVIIPVWIYILYFSNFIVDTAILAALGYIVARISRIKLPYKANFNMAIHALTLPIILKLIYIVIHSFIGFEIKYFDWMYTTISYIYIVVAILMIKTDLINRQMELIKLQEEQIKVREQMKDEKDKEEPEEKNEDTKEDKDKENEDNNLEGDTGTSEA